MLVIGIALARLLGGLISLSTTSGKWAFGLDPLVLAVIWAGTKGPATSPQIRPTAQEPLVPARYKALVLV
jgi:hypothetical protein